VISSARGLQPCCATRASSVLDEFDALVNVNIKGAYVAARQASRRWLSEGLAGHLVFTTSWVHQVPWPEIGPYTASKAAVVQLMRSFARELAASSIRANAMAPGIVGAGMAKHQWDTDPDYRLRAERAVPIGELQSPQSVADAFLFLCSDLASYMTGAVLTVDGGASLYPMD
jgi:NAD(P)-dependent dehydrogenase (short-subunit alcohol dehydrogenase family)